jgi:hypothetical protein
MNKNVGDLYKDMKKYKKEGFEGLLNQDIPRQFLEPVELTRNTKQKIVEQEKMNEQINNILRDTDIRTLQENYSYMMWTILALGALIITIKIKNS